MGSRLGVDYQGRHRNLENKWRYSKKLLAIILIVLTSWLGLAFYYFYGKDRMSGWLK